MVKNENGFSLIEVVIAIAILGVIAVALLGGLSTAFRTVFMADERATAEGLARSQMEDIKKQAYDGATTPPQYRPLADIPEGYAIDVTAQRLDPRGDGDGNDDGIQKITVLVSHYSKGVITLEGYKVDR